MGKDKPLTIEQLLGDIESRNGDAGVKRILKKFVDNNLIMASGILIIWTNGKSVQIDGSRFSDPETAWALQKALYEVMSKGISFND